MAEKTIQEICDDISYGQVGFPEAPDFTLGLNKLFIVNPNGIDDANVISALDSNASLGLVDNSSYISSMYVYIIGLYFKIILVFQVWEIVQVLD